MNNENWKEGGIPRGNTTDTNIYWGQEMKMIQRTEKLLFVTTSWQEHFFPLGVYRQDLAFHPMVFLGADNMLIDPTRKFLCFYTHMVSYLQQSA